jgi:thiol-disulfide isomerase/thioredoxin
MENIVQLGPLSLNAPVLFFALSLVFWFFVLRLLAEKIGASYTWLRSVSDGTILFGLIGSRLTFALWYWESYIAEPWTVFYFWQSGYSLFGGFFIAALYASFRFLLKPPTHKWRHAGLFVITSLLVFASTFGALLALNPPNKTNAPTLAPVRSVPFEFRDANGTPVGFADYDGVPMVLNFWATWCPPCRREMPLLENSYKKYAQQGVAIIAVNVGENSDIVNEFLAKQNLTLPVWQNGKHGTQQLFDYVNGQVMPTTLFIHADGRIESRRVGELSAATLQQGIEAIQPP